MSESLSQTAQSVAQTAAAVPHLEVALRHRSGALSLDVAFTLTQPWTVLFAPSGAGKTTILRAIAGLLQPQPCRIAWTPSGATKEILLTDTASRVALPPHARPVRMVGQQAALFPHRNVAKNVRYGMDLAARDEHASQDGEARIAELLALCRVEHLVAKLPAQLSGGEQQRVSLARTLAATGQGFLLLLDEPFTGLEAKLRDAIIPELREWLARNQTPVLSVTHDVAEAFQLGAEVIKLADGRVIEQGPVARVLGAERERLLEQLRTP